jgi:hypothetical protein
MKMLYMRQSSQNVYAFVDQFFNKKDNCGAVTPLKRTFSAIVDRFYLRGVKANAVK